METNHWSTSIIIGCFNVVFSGNRGSSDDLQKKRYKILAPFNINKVCNQQGFILVTVLFFLFIMSLMTLSLLNNSYLELRMSQNWVIAAQQFQAAEAGLKLAEHRLALLSMPIPLLHEHYNYAGFQIDAEVRRHRALYCINQSLAYIYSVIVQAKKINEGVLTLKTTYTIKEKKSCQQKSLTLKRAGRSSWRELSSSSYSYRNGIIRNERIR